MALQCLAEKRSSVICSIFFNIKLAAWMIKVLNFNLIPIHTEWLKSKSLVLNRNYKKTKWQIQVLFQVQKSHLCRFISSTPSNFDNQTLNLIYLSNSGSFLGSQWNSHFKTLVNSNKYIVNNGSKYSVISCFDCFHKSKGSVPVKETK